MTYNGKDRFLNGPYVDGFVGKTDDIAANVPERSEAPRSYPSNGESVVLSLFTLIVGGRSISDHAFEEGQFSLAPLNQFELGGIVVLLCIMYIATVVVLRAARSALRS